MSETVAELPTISDGLHRELAAVVGEDFVYVERQKVDEFKDAYWIPGDETYAAAAVVQPVSTEQIQEIMRIANRYEIPVWPHGQGRNYGYGGASPRVRGSIQIGFQKMNRVLEINDELAYAVVEPGVRWFDLYDAVKTSGYQLMTPTPDLGWGSVIGNSMDSGITYQFYGQDYMFPTGFEVVLPDGDLLRTGAGAQPGNKAWHLYKRSLGPSLDPLFVQSNLGIVTRMGVWLKRLPEAFAPTMLSIGEDEDLEQAIDTIRELKLAGYLEGVPTLYPTLRAAVMLRDDAVLDARTQVTAADVRAIAERTGVGAWAARAAVWGDAEMVELKLRRIREAWAKIPTGKVEAPRTFAPDEYDQLRYSGDGIMIGIPTQKAIENTPAHVAHIGFSPVVPLQGTEVRYVINEMRKHILAFGLNFSGGIMVTGERSAVVVAGMQYDKTDAAAVKNAFDLAKHLIVEIGKLGYGEYRAHLDIMDLAADQYSFNDHAYRRFVEKIKDAVDPKGILSPGRHGIWPAAYRDGGELRDRV
ncbi:FAD-binding oxidoreductase [Microbacterium rhizophilus]|uniref:FAD-binding oxidoreductase n=1 Tax=Microbacterium rhizophilus TaxID=3138934 RepID=UPI0031F0E633